MGRLENDIPRVDNGQSGWSAASFVGRLRVPDQQALLALGRPSLHPKGGHLLVEGDPGRFVLVLHGGPVKVVVHDTVGREHLLAIRSRGDLLGELAYLDHQPRSASVVTLSPTYVTKVCAERFSRFLDEHPHIGVELARYVGSRLRDADRSRLEISTDAVALRLARFLCNLAQESMPRSTRGYAVIPLTQLQLAQLVHAAEVTVNRIMRQFKSKGLIRTAYGRVEVPCLPCLDRLLRTLSAEGKEGEKDIRGCDGRERHGS